MQDSLTKKLRNHNGKIFKQKKLDNSHQNDEQHVEA